MDLPEIREKFWQIKKKSHPIIRSAKKWPKNVTCESFDAEQDHKHIYLLVRSLLLQKREGQGHEGGKGSNGTKLVDDDGAEDTSVGTKAVGNMKFT